MHVIGTAGHVDHGKSALVQALTGMDPDRFEEEKRRGLTIDLGFAWMTLPSGNEVGIVDVPGHERFIKNMLAGAGGITICLFVVAANEGWMPQSAEHLAILDVLRVRNGVVALTKSDTVDDDTLEVARAEVDERLAGSTLKGSPIVAVSAATGRGLDGLVTALDDAVASAAPAPDAGRPRLWIDRVFTIAGAGTVVTGTLAGGALTVAEEVEIAPVGRRARIRSIQSHKRQVESIGPGNRVALNLVGPERSSLQRGDAVVRPGQWRPTRTFDARVFVADDRLLGRYHELTAKGSHLLYVGAAETPVDIRLLDAHKVRSGDSALVRINARDALPLSRGDRFVLRDAGRILTFGGGVVLDPLPTRARPGPDEMRLLERLEDADAGEALRALVEGEGSITVNDALARAGAPRAGDGLVQLGDRLFSPTTYRALTQAVTSALENHHRDAPLERGMGRESLRAAVGLDHDAFDALIATMDDVATEGSIVHLASFDTDLPESTRGARDDLVARIESYGFTPPVAKDLDADPALVRALVDRGELIRIGDFYLSASQAREARARVRERIEIDGPQTVAQIRDLLGTSRKYAVPLCEWLDATGATVRRGDVRALGPRP